MWDLRTLKRLNKERVEYLRAQKQKQQEVSYDVIDICEKVSSTIINKTVEEAQDKEELVRLLVEPQD